MLKAYRGLFRFCYTTPNSHRADQNGRFMKRELALKYRHIALEEELPTLAKQQYEAVFVEKNQIETRIRRVLFDTGDVDVNKFRFSQDLRKDLRLDSLQITALLTSIQAQFTTVFQDQLFEGVEKLEDIVSVIHLDEKAF